MLYIPHYFHPIPFCLLLYHFFTELESGSVQSSDKELSDDSNFDSKGRNKNDSFFKLHY